MINNTEINNTEVCLTYEEAKDYLQEGDILLFKGRKLFSYFIKRMSHSKYSHVGITSWHNGDKGLWEIIEFRGIKGGRTVSLEQIVKKKPGVIDVYRPASQREEIYFDKDSKEVRTIILKFDPKSVTHRMRQLTGLNYGWKRIWWFLQWYIPVLRLIYDMEKLVQDKIGEAIHLVCSTSVAHSFTYTVYDLVKNRADDWTQPSDIACSNSLNYIFTLN